MASNIDHAVVAGFGDEWTRFDQSGVSEDELRRIFQSYFETFPWESLPPNSVGFDLGCGSGRWARLVAPRVGKLHLIDASVQALGVARQNLSAQKNCEFHHASVDDIPLADGSADFGYSLGVLHHVPDTAAGIQACVAKLKIGAPFLLYLYYAFDNRPPWFRAVWKVTEIARSVLSRSPHALRSAAAQAIALTVYLPLAKAALAAEKLGLDVTHIPLSSYRDKSLYTMRTDALDRFGTRLEQRFTQEQIREMMESAGLSDIRFGAFPYWCATGIKRR